MKKQIAFHYSQFHNLLEQQCWSQEHAKELKNAGLTNSGLYKIRLTQLIADALQVNSLSVLKAALALPRIKEVLQRLGLNQLAYEEFNKTLQYLLDYLIEQSDYDKEKKDFKEKLISTCIKAELNPDVIHAIGDLGIGHGSEIPWLFEVFKNLKSLHIVEKAPSTLLAYSINKLSEKRQKAITVHLSSMKTVNLGMAQLLLFRHPDIFREKSPYRHVLETAFKSGQAIIATHHGSPNKKLRFNPEDLRTLSVQGDRHQESWSENLEKAGYTVLTIQAKGTAYTDITPITLMPYEDKTYQERYPEGRDAQLTIGIPEEK